MKIPLLVLCALLGAPKLTAEKTESILTRMDDAAVSFKSVSAEVRMTVFTKIINDTDTQTGKLEMQRPKDKSMRALLDLKGDSDARVVFFHDNIVQLYTPKSKLLQDYDVGKSNDLVEKFLLLGFGSSGKELLENYDITNAGSETVSGRETTKLVLLPKSAQVKEKINKVEMWIPAGESYPIQQQFYAPNGNYRIMEYNKLQFNAIRQTLQFRPPAGTKRQGS